MNFDQLQKETFSALQQAFLDSQEKYFSKSPLRPMLEYHFQSGGKRLRPLLVFASALAYGRLKGASEENLISACVPYALAVELLHNATLIHDDIQDGDRTRRGTETLWVKYSMAQAINCGDAWFFVPQLLVQAASYGPDLKLALLSLLQHRSLAVIGGQSEEFFLKEKFARGEEVSVAQYLAMVDGKTSALFSMPLLGGALIAGAGVLERNALELSSVHLGHAFQIQDDLLDLWGDKGRGSSGSDIAEGKLSYPLVLLLSRLGRASSQRKEVEAIIRAPREKTTRDQIDFVIRLMESEGIKEQAKKDFYQYLSEAKSSSLWQEVLRALGDWLESQVKVF